jgi:hypothetical protein
VRTFGGKSFLVDFMIPPAFPARFPLEERVIRRRPDRISAPAGAGRRVPIDDRAAAAYGGVSMTRYRTFWFTGSGAASGASGPNSVR